MHILAIPATNSRNGINRQLLTHVARVFDNDLEAKVELVDIGDYEMPIYSPEREQADGGPPAEAHQLFGRVGAADGIVISFAEHNGSYSAAWKNLYDWMSRIDQNVLQHKPTVLLAATPGPRAGAGVLASASAFLPHAGAQLVGHTRHRTLRRNVRHRDRDHHQPGHRVTPSLAARGPRHRNRP